MTNLISVKFAEDTISQLASLAQIVASEEEKTRCKLGKCKVCKIYCGFSPLLMQISLSNVPIGRSCLFANFILIKFAIDCH